MLGVWCSVDRAASHYLCESETKQDVSQTSQNEEGLAIKRLLALMRNRI